MVKVSKAFQLIRMNRKIGRHTINGVSANGVNWWVDQRQYHLPGLFMAFPKDALTIVNLVLSAEVLELLKGEYPQLFSQLKPSTVDTKWMTDALEDQEALRGPVPRVDGTSKSAPGMATRRRVRHVR